MESESIWTVHTSLTVDPKGSVVAVNATPLKNFVLQLNMMFVFNGGSRRNLLNYNFQDILLHNLPTKPIKRN